MMTPAHCHLVECFSRGVGVATGSLEGNFLWVEAGGEVRDIATLLEEVNKWEKI